MSALIFDTETTGLREPQVIEAAWLRITSLTPLATSDAYEQRFRPNKPIDFGAMATHHITDEDLAHCQPSNSFRLPDGVQYLIGHNIDYDWGVIGQPDVRRIDTLALSRLLWPETDSHKQTALLYMLDRPFAKQHAPAAHWACPVPPDRSDGMIMPGEGSDDTKQKAFHGRIQTRGGAAD